MDFQRGRIDRPTSTGPGTITGSMLLDRVLEGEGVGVSSVMFEPGSRTNWHSHTGGQLFFVSAGSGMVATRDGDYRQVQAGDVVWAPPGEVHWHGASKDAFLVYTAASLGASEWFDPVTDQQFAEAWDGAK
jgi:quercetin dioxygenase-like cupin family protein